MENDEIEMVFTIKQLQIIDDALKGELVRHNDMNFDYLQKVTKIGAEIEDKLRCYK